LAAQRVHLASRVVKVFGRRVDEEVMTDRAQPESLTPCAGSLTAEFVDEIFSVQSLVACRAPLAAVYQAVVDGALRLLRAEIGSLRFVDVEDPTWMVAVAWSGSAGSGERWRHRAPISEGVSGQVISTGRVVAVEDGLQTNGSQLVPIGVQALLGAPIREHTRVVGSLIVGSMQPGRKWTPSDRDMLATYARHVSVAMLVAGRGHALRQALIDPLTGLGNRGFLLDRLHHELVRADRGARPPTILFLDLDRFKSVNDSLGHFAGDQLLKAVAERLHNCVREEDVCARLAGDEFAVLLAAGPDPAAAAQRMIAAISRPFEIADTEIAISVSIGIATGTDDADSLLRDADSAMYKAKRTGAGHYERYQPSTPDDPSSQTSVFGGTLDDVVSSAAGRG
jgi:diguanylate cyclase (GGDEF)-like protein